MHINDHSAAVKESKRQKDELRLQLDKQVFQQKALREINRLFPDDRAILTSKSLLKNLNLKLKVERPRFDRVSSILLEEEDQEVELEIQRLNSIIERI
jgi:hypothetical protein